MFHCFFHRIKCKLPTSVQIRRRANICPNFHVDHSEFEVEDFELIGCCARLIHWPEITKSVILLLEKHTGIFQQDKKMPKIGALLSNRGKYKYKQI